MQSLHPLTTAKEIAPGGQITYTPEPTLVGGAQLPHRSASIEENKQDPVPHEATNSTSPSYRRTAAPLSVNLYTFTISHYSVFAPHTLYSHSLVLNHDLSNSNFISLKFLSRCSRSVDRNRSLNPTPNSFKFNYLSRHRQSVSSRTTCFPHNPDTQQDPRIGIVLNNAYDPIAPATGNLQQRAGESHSIDPMPKSRVHLRSRIGAPTEKQATTEKEIATNTHSTTADCSPRFPTTEKLNQKRGQQEILKPQPQANQCDSCSSGSHRSPRAIRQTNINNNKGAQQKTELAQTECVSSNTACEQYNSQHQRAAINKWPNSPAK